MTVYELIQKLAEYEPDKKVRFHLHMDTEVYSEELEMENLNDKGFSDYTFDDDLSIKDIASDEWDKVKIELEY